jgi:hypothetical protein
MMAETTIAFAFGILGGALALTILVAWLRVLRWTTRREMTRDFPPQFWSGSFNRLLGRYNLMGELAAWLTGIGVLYWLAFGVMVWMVIH